jgi:hypothetical protein
MQGDAANSLRQPGAGFFAPFVIYLTAAVTIVISEE